MVNQQNVKLLVFEDFVKMCKLLVLAYRELR